MGDCSVTHRDIVTQETAPITVLARAGQGNHKVWYPYSGVGFFFSSFARAWAARTGEIVGFNWPGQG